MMSNNMCSLENGSSKHSISAIVSSCSPSYSCSPLGSKPFGSHLYSSMASPLPLPPHSGHTAFPFPPNPSLFLSSINLFNPQSPMSWFSAHNSLNTPLSLTTSQHRILKPPNISLLDPIKSDPMTGQSGPLSAPPIPDVRRQDFLKSISDSDIRNANESIVGPNNCHNMSLLDPIKSDPMTGQSPPLSAPPIPVVRRQDFLKSISDSDITDSTESIVDPNNCHTISISDPNKSDPMTGQSPPLSAPPIPVVRRQDFLKNISDSDKRDSNESIVEPNKCHNFTPFSHHRRKSVPQTTSHKSLPSLTGEEVPGKDSHYLVPNENCLPIEGHNRLQYPVYFRKGSIIQLANGNVKRVEEMSTQDFIDSATDSPDLCADCSEVIKIEEKIKSCSVLLSFSVGRTKVPVTVEAPVEHPFFVFHKGWSSFSPERSHSRYGLKCRKLRVGDNCVSLTPRTTSAPNLTQSTHK